MKFNDAYKGIGYLFTAGILNLIASVFNTIVLLFLYLQANKIVDEDFGLGDGSGVLFSGGILLAGVVVSGLEIAAYIMQTIGSSKASKDEKSFKVVLYMIAAGVVITIVSAFFSDNHAVSGMTSALEDFISLFVTIYILQGIINLANKMDDAAMASQGARLYRTLISVYAFIISVRMFTMAFSGTGFQVTASILTIIAGILSVFQYVLYIRYLASAKKMLA